MKKTDLLLLVSVVFLAVSCHRGGDDLKRAPKPGGKDMEEVNRYLLRKDREVILNYIERKKLTMTESPTGLWYMIQKPGTGEYLKDNDRVIINFECYLLDGTPCYSSSEQGPKDIIIGRTGLEPGMNEGLKLLKRGSEAIFIIPPFLAYGLVGDGKKIPPRSTIVYNVRIAQ
ncbi:MAG TPA: FKBP-type peptidyl-prolyl cis-trans isomerase [Bacteroidales bacterium]|nr:FKBP-type peptidyl-prolyl cis-trans isomerase [Bacteroidales bacterium]